MESVQGRLQVVLCHYCTSNGEVLTAVPTHGGQAREGGGGGGGGGGGVGGGGGGGE